MISVVIPALEEEKYLPLLLRDLRQQSLKPGEIIVVDGGSKDRTVQVAKEGKAQVVCSRIRNAAVQRNMGARHARGDVLVFVDADMRVPSRGMMGDVEEALRSHVGATAVSQVLKEERSWKDVVVFAPVNMCARMIPGWVGRGGFMAVRADVFEKLGGFDVNRAVSEDVEFFRRVARVGSVTCLKRGVEESGRRYRREGHAPTIMRWMVNGVWAAVTGHSWDTEWRPIR